MASNNKKTDEAESPLLQELRMKNKALAELYESLANASTEASEYTAKLEADVAYRNLHQRNERKSQIEMKKSYSRIELLTETVTSFESTQYADEYQTRIEILKKGVAFEREALLKRLMEHNARVEQTMRELDQESRSLEEVKQKFQNEIRGLQMEMWELAARDTSMAQENNVDQLEWEELQLRMKLFDDNVNLTKDLEEQIQVLTKETQEIENILLKYDVDLQNINREIENKKIDIQLLAQELEQDKTFVEQIDKLSNDIQIYERGIEIMKDETTAIEKSNEKLNNNIKELQAFIANCEEQSRALQQTEIMLKEELDMALAKNKSTSKKVIAAKTKKINDENLAIITEEKMSEEEERLVAELARVNKLLETENAKVQQANDEIAKIIKQTQNAQEDLDHRGQAIQRLYAEKAEIHELAKGIKTKWNVMNEQRAKVSTETSRIEKEKDLSVEEMSVKGEPASDGNDSADTSLEAMSQ